MNILSFRQSPWYSSGVFILVVVVLTSVYIIALGSVSPFITTLSSSSIRLLVGCGDYRNGNNRNDLISGAIPGPGVARVSLLPTIDPNAYSLSG